MHRTAGQNLHSQLLDCRKDYSIILLRFDFDLCYLSDIDSLRWWSLYGRKIWTTKNLTFKSLNLQKKVLLFFYIPFAIFKLCTTLTTLLFLGGPRQHSCHLHQSRVSISYSLLICSCSCGAVISSLIFNSISSVIVHGKASFQLQTFVMHFFLGSCHFQFQLLMLNFQLPASLHIIQGWSLFSSPIFGGFPSGCCIVEQ